MRRICALAVALAGCTFSTDYGGTEYRCDDGVCPPGFLCVAGRCEPQTPPGDAAQLDGPADATLDGPVVDAPEADAALPDATTLYPPWWDPAFPHRMQMTVVNNAAAEMPGGFQAGWLFDINALPGYDEVMNSSNLHVARWDGASWTDVDRIIDDTALSQEWVWIRLPDIVPPGGTDATHWMYWGHPTPPAAPASASAVFDFWESFSSGTAPDADWVVLGEPSLASGDLLLDNQEEIRSVATWGPGWAVDFTMRVPTWLARFWGGFQVAGTFAQDQPWVIWISRDSTEIWPEIQSSEAGIDPAWEGTRRPFDAADHYYYYIDRFSDRAVYRYDGEGGVDEVTFPNPFTSALNIRFTNDGAPTMQIGFARIRKTIYPLPTTSFGPMDSYP